MCGMVVIVPGSLHCAFRPATECFGRDDKSGGICEVDAGFACGGEEDGVKSMADADGLAG